MKPVRNGPRMLVLGLFVLLLAGLAVGLKAAPAGAAIAFVQKTPNTTLPAGGGGSCVTSPVNLTFGSTPVAGNFIAVYIADNEIGVPNVSSVTDNRGGTYTQAVVATTPDGVGRAWIYYRENITTGSP